MESFFKRDTLFLLCAVLIAAGLGTTVAIWGMGASEPVAPYQSSSWNPATCNVLAVTLHGEMMTSRSNIPLIDTVTLQQPDGSTLLSAPNYSVSSDIEDALMRAKGDPSIKAVILDVDSPGGSGVAGQEIARALRALSKPSAAVVHGMAASGAYMAAIGADRIFALDWSDIGSIGVTSSYVDQVEKNRKDGYTYHTLSSGPFKDTGSPDKPLTPAEEALIMRDIKIGRDSFVQMVSLRRNLPVDAVSALADGSTMMGRQALAAGLVDEIGGLEEARTYIEEHIGEPVTVCWQ